MDTAQLWLVKAISSFLILSSYQNKDLNPSEKPYIFYTVTHIQLHNGMS